MVPSSKPSPLSNDSVLPGCRDTETRPQTNVFARYDDVRVPPSVQTGHHSLLCVLVGSSGWGGGRGQRPDRRGTSRRGTSAHCPAPARGGGRARRVAGACARTPADVVRHERHSSGDARRPDGQGKRQRGGHNSAPGSRCQRGPGTFRRRQQGARPRRRAGCRGRQHRQQAAGARGPGHGGRRAAAGGRKPNGHGCGPAPRRARAPCPQHRPARSLRAVPPREAKVPADASGAARRVLSCVCVCVCVCAA